LNPVLIAVPGAVSVIATYYSLKWWIKRAFELGFTGRDMNKYGKPQVAETGGVWVTVGSSFGLLTLLALDKYLYGVFQTESILALSLMLFMASFIGFLDDLMGWKKGIKQIYRVLAMLPLSIPLVVIKAGYSKISIPFIGVVDTGLLYPLIIVPIGVMGASNAFNMIAGYNGLEALQAVILLSFTAIFSLTRGIELVFYCSIVMIFSLIVFLKYNWYPAHVFPGNSLTYGVGAYYASLVIIGNFEKFGLMMFTLYFIELILFIRGLRHGVYKENFGIPDENNYLNPPYDRIYSITHFAIRIQRKILGKATEKGVVYVIALLQLIICIISLLLYSLI